MKKYLFILLLVSPIIFFGQRYSISGTVIDQQSQKAMPDVKISIDDLDLYIKVSKEGKFKINKLKAGKHLLLISHIGYQPKSYSFDLSKNKSFTIEMSKANILTEEVIIRATRVQENTPATYTTISEKQLQENNMGQDLPYLLKRTPSVITTSDAGNGIGYTGIRIRGSDLTRINVTLNGVPVNDPESHNVFFVDLPDLASSVNDIQVQRGVGTSTNGAASFGGSINIETSHLKDKAYATLNSSYGSFNTFKNTLSFGTGKLKNNLAFDGRISSILSDGYIDRASSNLKSAYLSGGYFGKKTIIKALVNIGKEKTYQSWYGIPKDMLEENRTYNPAGEMENEEGEIIGFYDNQIDNYQQNYYQLHLAHQITKNIHFNTSLFYTQGYGYYESYKNNRKLSKYGFEPVIVGNDTIRRTNLVQQKWLDNDYYGQNAAISYKTNKLELTIGEGWNQYVGAHYGIVIDSDIENAPFLDKKWYENTGRKTDLNVYAKASYSILKNLNLYGDLQYRKIDYSIDGTHDDLRDITQNYDFNFFNPKGGIYYQINEHQHLYTSVGIAHREPNRTVYREADAEQLKHIFPEKLIDYELGYKVFYNKIQLETNLFYMDYENQLVMTGQINDVGAYIMTNVPESYRAGIEFMSNVALLKSFNWYFTATFSQNKIRNFTSYVDDWDTWGQNEEIYQLTDISFSPSLTASNELSYQPIKSLNLLFSSNYVGRQYIDNTQNLNRSLDPYLVHDFKIIYTPKVKIVKKLQFSLAINNIFNHQYETNAWIYRYYSEGQESMMSGYYPQAGINFMGGIKIGI